MVWHQVNSQSAHEVKNCLIIKNFVRLECGLERFIVRLYITRILNLESCWPFSLKLLHEDDDGVAMASPCPAPCSPPVEGWTFLVLNGSQDGPYSTRSVGHSNPHRYVVLQSFRPGPFD